jgi:PAS domain S-box-containing protein
MQTTRSLQATLRDIGTLLALGIALILCGMLVLSVRLIHNTIMERQQVVIRELARQSDQYLADTERFMNTIAAALPELSPAGQGELLARSRANDTHFTSLDLLDANGRVIAEDAGQGSQLNQDLSREVYFAKARNSHQLYISEPFISPNTGEASVTVVLPIQRGTQFLGLLVGELNLAGLREIISQAEVGQEGVAYIVDQSGVLLAHPRQEWVQERRSLANLALVRNGLNGAETIGAFYNDPLSTWQLGSATTIRFGWVVAAAQPAIVAGQPIIWMFIGTALAFGLCLLAFFLVRERSVWQIVNPITALVQRADALAGALHTAMPDAQPGDLSEITSVNHSLAHMASRLQAALDELQQHAAARRHAEQTLQQQHEYMEALHTTGLSLLNRLDLDDLLEAIVVRAGALLATPDGFLYLVDEDADELDTRVGVGIFSEQVGLRLKRGEGLAGTIWQTGTPLAVADYDTWPGSPAHLRQGGFHALVGVPLTYGARVVGVIGLAYREPGRHFDADTISFLTRFAQLASLALEHVRLYSAAQQELSDRERAVEALRTTERNLRLIAENTRDVFFAYDMNHRLIYINAAFESLTGYSIAELREQEFINYLHRDDEARMLALFEATFRGHTFADAEYRIVMRSGEVRWCSSSVGPLLDEHGVQIGVQGLERDISERKRVEENQQFMVEASALLVASLDYETTLTKLTQFVVPYLADWCKVHVLQPDQSIHLVAQTFADPAKQALSIEIDREYPVDLTGRYGFPKVIRTGQPELRSEISDAFLAQMAIDDRHLQLQRATEPRSAMVLPLIARGRTLGAITFVSTTPEHRYGEADMEMAKDLAHRAALAVDNARLYRASQRRLAEVTTIQNVAWAINSTLRLSEMFRTVVTQVSAVFGYQMVSIYLREGDGLALQSYVGYDEVMWFMGLDQAVSGRVVRTGAAAFVRDAAADPDFIFVQPNTRQAIIVPFKHGMGEVLGVLLIESTGTPILTDDDFTLLTLLADQISVAVANARLFAELRTSEQRYRSLLEQAADTIFVTDLAGRIVDANEQASALLGYTRDELLGMGLHDLVAPTDVAEAHESFTRLRRSGRATAALRLRHRDGVLFPVEINAAAIDADVVLAIVRDVSERLRLENQLRQAQKLEAIGTLANGIAHDFNNLLAAIAGYADLALESTPPDDPRHADLQQISRATQRGAGLTRQLLTFSRPAAPERRPLYLAELAQEAYRLLRPTIPSTISIQAELASDSWLIEADAAQVQQVLVNLVVNARDAMPNGGTLKIGVVNVLLDADQGRRLNIPAGPYVRLSVADSGIGMDEQTVSRIFEPFFTTKMQGKGTGLGLSVTHGIVRGHGGIIDVVSRPEQGTTMMIYFPASGAVAGPFEEAVGGAAQGQDELILVVDDEPAVRQLGKRMLERYGYRVLLAEDGLLAIEIFRAHAAEIAAVVLDLTMPGMDGRATFAALRAISGVPVIFSSGQSAAELAMQLAAPDTMFIAKPYNLVDLTRAVGQIVQSGRKPIQ